MKPSRSQIEAIRFLALSWPKPPTWASTVRGRLREAFWEQDPGMAGLILGLISLVWGSSALWSGAFSTSLYGSRAFLAVPYPSIVFGGLSCVAGLVKIASLVLHSRRGFEAASGASLLLWACISLLYLLGSQSAPWWKVTLLFAFCNCWLFLRMQVHNARST